MEIPAIIFLGIPRVISRARKANLYIHRISPQFSNFSRKLGAYHFESNIILHGNAKAMLLTPAPCLRLTPEFAIKGIYTGFGPFKETAPDMIVI